MSVRIPRLILSPPTFVQFSDIPEIAVIMSASASPKDIYTAFVEAINARDWPAAQAVLAPTFTANDVETTPEALTQQIAGLSAAGPDLTSTIDFMLPSSCGTKAFSRIIHRFTLAQDALGVKATGKPVEFAEASFFWVKDGKVYKNFTIIDMAALAKGEGVDYKIASSMTAANPAPEGFDLLAAYRSYVELVQQGPTVENLSKFCHENLNVNNKDIKLEEYVGNIEEAKATIEGMHWDLVETVVDEQKQQIAARVVLTGKPVKDFAGIAPTGNSVRFPEHVLYQFDGAKIKQVVQLMDFNAYRSTLQTNA